MINNSQIVQVAGIIHEQPKHEIFPNQSLDKNFTESETILPDCSNLENKSNIFLPKTIKQFDSKDADKISSADSTRIPCTDSPRISSTDSSRIPNANSSRKSLQSSKTYGLRPRTELRKPSYDCDTEEKEIPVEVVRRPRGQYRNSLMSKYRRRTANARERHRMKEINDAFSTLRGILPPLSNRRSSQVSMTKIRTLRLAASYIQALSDLLQDADEGGKKSSITNSAITYYSDSILQKFQTKTSGNFHSTCNFKPKRTKKNLVTNNQKNSEKSDHNIHSISEKDSYSVPLPNSDTNFISESETSLKHSWDVSHMDTTDKDLLALLEESTSPSSEIDGNLNSWADYKTLEDFYFALN